ncbi:MAG: hypothetical protein JWN56_1975 [Sphingobacteriales bacterium]|nr:hypothetical protein [Sphingobacteriales bacterium]
MLADHQEWFINYFENILQRTLNPAAFEWLKEKINQLSSENKSAIFFSAFTAIPRQTAKALVVLTEQEQLQLAEKGEGFSISNYTVDRLARVYLLLHWLTGDKTNYFKTITQLFKAAEMNELVALYGALPLLSYPEEWAKQCAEGIRSNIGTVLEAIMCDNPYPAKYLDEASWNQLVLKAFFTEKPINRIIGLDDRANKSLANTLFDYAHERWAAGRSVEPQLWRLVGKFIDERTFPDIQRVFQIGNQIEKQAAALACAKSEFEPALALLENEPDLKSAIENNNLNWNVIKFQ